MLDRRALVADAAGLALDEIVPHRLGGGLQQIGALALPAPGVEVAQGLQRDLHLAARNTQGVAALLLDLVVENARARLEGQSERALRQAEVGHGSEYAARRPGGKPSLCEFAYFPVSSFTSAVRP